MPQKAIYKRPPLMICQQIPARNGQVRVDDPGIKAFYQKCSSHIDRPEMWEGLFGLACLVTDKPLEEPVTELILNAACKQQDGQFEGDLSCQLQIARAVLSVCEYRMDRTLMQKLTAWCRALEINWDVLTKDTRVIRQPADLMEFLISLYRITGIKAVLRLCA